MNCTINSASHFSGLQAGMSPISLVQLTATVRKSTLDRSFILPILAQTHDNDFLHGLTLCGNSRALCKDFH